VLTDQQRGQALAHGQGFVDRARRPMAQHLNSIHDAPEFGNNFSDLLLDARLARGRKQAAGGLEMTLFELPKVVIETSLVATLGVPGGIEQKVGDLRHCGDDCNHGLPGDRLGDQVTGGTHALSGSDTGSAELHHEKIRQIF
jgi:hypothetical protein